MKFKKSLSFLFLFLINAFSIASPFQHDLNLQTISGSGTPTLCLHGYGGSGEMLLGFLKTNQATGDPLIAINFPDFDISKNSFDPHITHFGTIDELLPALYTMKKTVVDEGMSALNLYGFSAGGGAAINCLAALNTHRYDADLQTIGIGPKEKIAILEAIQNGFILLDAPLKSMDEIIAFRGDTEEFLIIANRYLENDLRPIDSLKHLSGLSLNIVLFFQTPDEILSNRDDTLFIDELKKANANGQTHVLLADQGGHNTFHSMLWDTYKKIVSLNKIEK